MGPQANLQNLDHPLHILKSGSFGYISGMAAWLLDILITAIQYDHIKETTISYYPLLSSELFNSKERATTYFPMRRDPFSNKITIVHF